jgi:hypothetical protein
VDDAHDGDRVLWLVVAGGQLNHDAGGAQRRDAHM